MKADVKELIGKILNTPVVVETGTSGIWTYRKWSDGTAECWGTNTYTLAHYAVAGGFYAYYTSVSFPASLFIARPTFVYGACVDSVLAWAGPILGLSSAGTNIYALASVSGTQSVAFDMYAKGKWK